MADGCSENLWRPREWAGSYKLGCPGARATTRDVPSMFAPGIWSCPTDGNSLESLSAIKRPTVQRYMGIRWPGGGSLSKIEEVDVGDTTCGQQHTGQMRYQATLQLFEEAATDEPLERWQCGHSVSFSRSQAGAGHQRQDQRSHTMTTKASPAHASRVTTLECNS